MEDRSKEYIATTLVNQLLYSTTAQEKLLEEIWALWTTEQKRQIADVALEVAMAKMKEIIPTRLYSIGTNAGGRPNLFARHVGDAVKAAFNEPLVANAVQSLIQTEMAETLQNLKYSIPSMIQSLLKEVMLRSLKGIQAQQLKQIFDEVATNWEVRQAQKIADTE